MVHEVERLLKSALTVGELIEQLKARDPESKVLFTCSYGDYHNTPQVLGIRSIEERDAGELVESGYSHSQVALRDWDEDDEEEDDTDFETIVLLS